MTLRTTVVGSWPPVERYRSLLARYFSAQADELGAEPLLTEVAAVAIAQQQAMRPGRVHRRRDVGRQLILHFPRFLTGIELTDQRDAWGGRGSYALIGSVGAPGGLP